jgi:multidrug resistance efflux pump
VGDYVSTGKPVLSLVDARSFHVDGYFEETKLDRVQVNQPVEIQIMGSRASCAAMCRALPPVSKTVTAATAPPAAQCEPHFQLGAAGTAHSGAGDAG